MKNIPQLVSSKTIEVVYIKGSNDIYLSLLMNLLPHVLVRYYVKIKLKLFSMIPIFRSVIHLQPDEKEANRVCVIVLKMCTDEETVILKIRSLFLFLRNVGSSEPGSCSRHKLLMFQF